MWILAYFPYCAAWIFPTRDPLCWSQLATPVCDSLKASHMGDKIQTLIRWSCDVKPITLPSYLPSAILLFYLLSLPIENDSEIFQTVGNLWENRKGSTKWILETMMKYIKRNFITPLHILSVPVLLGECPALLGRLVSGFLPCFQKVYTIKYLHLGQWALEPKLVETSSSVHMPKSVPHRKAGHIHLV